MGKGAEMLAKLRRDFLAGTTQEAHQERHVAMDIGCYFTHGSAVVYSWSGYHLLVERLLLPMQRLLLPGREGPRPRPRRVD